MGSDNIRGMLILAFMCTAFVVALTVALNQVSSVSGAMELTKGKISGEKYVATGLSDKPANVVSGSVVIQTIFHMMDNQSTTFVPGVGNTSPSRNTLSIVVNGRTYTSDMGRESLDMSSINANGSYTPVYTYTNGVLTRVTYTQS